MSPLLCALSLALAQTPAPVVDAGTVPPDYAAAAADAVEAAKLAAEAAGKAAAAVAALGPSAAPPAPPAPVAPPAAPRTTSVFGLGLIWMQGNSNALTLSGSLGLAHKFDAGWGASLKLNAAYGQAQVTGTTTQSVTAYNAGGTVRGDRTFGSEVQVFVQGGALTDHVASLELRYFGEGGAGIIWLDHKAAGYQQVMLRTDLGLRAAQDNNWQYYPTATNAGTGHLPDIFFLGPSFAVAFLYALNKGVVFSEDASLGENIDGDSRTMVSSTTKLSAALLGHVSFATTFLVTYDSNLANLGKVDTDTALTLGLEGTF